MADRPVRRDKVVCFFETDEAAAAVRTAIGTRLDVLAAVDLTTFKLLLRTHAGLTAAVVEYTGLSAAPLVALEVASRIAVVPRRLLLTTRGVTAGVLESVRDGAATGLIFLPRCGEALRAAVTAPAPGLWRPRAA